MQKHIVCAWVVPGTDKYESESYCDDGDHGIGSKLLQMLQDNNIRCRAIYIVRKCGEKLNADRYAQYFKCASETVRMNAGIIKSLALKIRWKETGNMTYAAAVKSPPKRAQPVTRGRGGRYRGGRGCGGSNTYRKKIDNDAEKKLYIPVIDEETTNDMEWSHRDEQN